MNLVTLECPLCQGMIQVDAAMAGQQMACPLCQGTMQVPPAEAFTAAVPPPAPLHDAPTWSGAMPPVPAPMELVSLACPACGGMFQVPPAAAGMQLPCPTCRQLVTIPQWSMAVAPTPVGIAAPSPSPADNFPDDISSLLPPGAAAGSAAADTTLIASSRPTVVETLVPRGVAETGPPGEQVALPKAPQPTFVPPSGAPAGSILIPTPEGQVVALQDKPKVLGHGESEIEVRRLSPQEKARRRTLRNVILFVVGVVTLLAIGIVMMRR